MFGFFRSHQKETLVTKVRTYIDNVYVEPEENEDGKVKYSLRIWDESEEDYSFEMVSHAMEDYFKTGEAKSLINELEKARRKTFTEMLIWHIAKQGKKDSAVYNAAQMDRRLFSKIMADREYKPSKDTAIALILALRLNLREGEDLLRRAGYSLSHSSKRDIAIEYFIREGVNDFLTINIVLHALGEKKIGR